MLLIYASHISGLSLLVLYVYSFQRQFDRRKAEECRESGFEYPSTPFSNSDADAEDHYRGYGNGGDACRGRCGSRRGNGVRNGRLHCSICCK